MWILLQTTQQKFMFTCKFHTFVDSALNTRATDSVVHRAGRYCAVPSCTVNYTHAQKIGICRHNTDNAHIDKHREPYM